MRGIRVIIILFCLPVLHNAFAQDSTLIYTYDLRGALSSTAVPLWLRANQNGAVPNNGPFLLGQAGLYQTYHKHNPRTFQWSAGMQVVAHTGKSSDLFFSDLYVAGKAGPFEIAIGQRKEFTSLSDSLLTSGSVAMSQNFRPYPKIQLSTPWFTNLIPGRDFIAFKFSYSDGLLGRAAIQYGAVNEVPEAFLHQKTLYLRLGGSAQKLNLYAGFNHQAMWGGEAKIWGGGLKTWEAYKYVVIGKPWFGSRVGNHFGTIDLAGEWKGSNWQLFAYRQNIYEDGSLIELSNIVDGLNGFRIKRAKKVSSATLFTVNTILVEYLYTKSQGGPIFDFNAGIFGADNYFNHYVYRDGWSYRGHSLGTPLIGPKASNRAELPSLESSFTNNNRISAVHLGIEAAWKEMAFTAKGTFSNNFGIYRTPFSPPVKQVSLFIHAERPVSLMKGSMVTMSIATDIGRLYPNSTALMFGWKKTGYLK